MRSLGEECPGVERLLCLCSERRGHTLRRAVRDGTTVTNEQAQLDLAPHWPTGLRQDHGGAHPGREVDRAVHLESDRLFEFIVAGFVEPWKRESHEQNAVVMRIVCNAAASYAEAGYFTIVDGILIPGWFFETVRDCLQARGLTVSYAVLRPALVTAIERVQARVPRKIADPAVIKRLWTSFDDLGSLERHVIDNDADTPDQTAAILAGYLRQRSLSTRPW